MVMGKAPCSICGRRDLTDPCADCDPLNCLQRIAVRNVRMSLTDLATAWKRAEATLREARQANVSEFADRIFARIFGKRATELGEMRPQTDREDSIPAE